MLPRVLILVLLAPLCFAQPSSSDDRAALAVMRGQPERVEHVLGVYFRYIPRDDVRGVVVLVHGSVGENESAADAAQTFLGRWIPLADQQRMALLVPAFDQKNFGGRAGPGGGYRGLFGRVAGADAFVNAIVEETRETLPDLPGRFALYGHSAGGQFVSRYVVMHPERVRAAVISAAGTFAFPDPDVAWTNGMKPLRRRIRWSDDETWKDVEIVPDPQGWVEAARIPIAVVVGSLDTDAIRAVPGNPGRSHVARARAWVQAMDEFARTHGRTPRIRYVEDADVGHNSALLTPTCQKALRECLAESRDGSEKEETTDPRP